jgi:hypothetical protein
MAELHAVQQNAIELYNDAIKRSEHQAHPDNTYFLLWDWEKGNIWTVVDLYHVEDFDRHWQTHPVQTWVWVQNDLYLVAFREGVTYGQIARMVEQYHTGYKVRNVDLGTGNVRR